ncbi:MAG: CPBP family intramembrane metalloprotease [Thaumarchaeota archaeon]|nr:CPBP family intramembrane metalloprotease [Nitrososphaerota archaeon]
MATMPNSAGIETVSNYLLQRNTINSLDLGQALKVEEQRSERAQFKVRSFILYVVVAYGFSWAFWLPQVLASNGFMQWSFFSYIVGFIAPFGPTVSAFSITYWSEGRDAAKSLLRRGSKYRLGKWFFPLFMLSPLWAGSALLLGSLTEIATINLPWVSNPFSLVFNFGIYNFAYLFIFFGAAEEFGWRGYALQKLQPRLGDATISAIVVGSIWTFWHSPLFFIKGSAMQAAGLLPSIAETVVFSIWLTWFYNNTGGSVLATMIFHSFNALTLFVIFPVTYIFSPGSLPVIFLYATAAVITVAIVSIWGPKKLVRRKDMHY